MYRTVVLDAPGKVNLSLDITGRRADGYHEVDSILQAVDLHDTVRITRETQPGVFISCDRPRIPCDETNHAHIAAQRFFERFMLSGTGISIDIQKRIPIQAGLGGGSADAAGVLVGLNVLFETGASLEELAQIGARVGADVPFCILGGTRRARGIGDKLETLTGLPPRSHVLIAKPEAGISTPESYRRYDQNGAQRRPDTARLIRLLEEQNLSDFAKGMQNVLQEVAELPEVGILQRKMLDCGALGAMMSGSGSAVFGLFESRAEAKHCMRKLYDLAESVFLTQTVSHGAVVLDLQA